MLWRMTTTPTPTARNSVQNPTGCWRGMTRTLTARLTARAKMPVLGISVENSSPTNNCMECCIMRKVVYRLPNTKRLTWAIVLAEREGLSLLFVRGMSGSQSSGLVIGSENVSQRIFEDVQASRFPLETADLAAIGGKLRALGGSLSEDELMKFLEPNDDWSIE